MPAVPAVPTMPAAELLAAAAVARMPVPGAGQPVLHHVIHGSFLANLLPAVRSAMLCDHRVISHNNPTLVVYLVLASFVVSFGLCSLSVCRVLHVQY
jgi:hypothetical protein